MRNRIGRTIAVAFLCTVAATVGLWSGPLAAASGSLHSGVTQGAHVSAAHATP